MSKTVAQVPTALAANYLLETSTLAIGMLITRTDAAVYGLTSADVATTISGVAYTPGLDPKNIDLSAGLSVDNLELTILDDTSLITRIDALEGIWRNASFLIFEYNYVTPTDGINPLIAGVFGEITLGLGIINVELRGLQQALQQTIGAMSSKTCRARLGDAQCLKPLGPLTVTGTLTNVASRQVFTDTARTEADDYFAEGLFTFTTGVCAGLTQKVKIYAADVFTLSLPMIQLPSVGDAYSVIAGCRKRLPEDCVTKFNNVLNFDGEYHLPGPDAMTKPLGL